MSLIAFVLSFMVGTSVAQTAANPVYGCILINNDGPSYRVTDYEYQKFSEPGANVSFDKFSATHNMRGSVMYGVKETDTYISIMDTGRNYTGAEMTTPTLDANIRIRYYYKNYAAFTLMCGPESNMDTVVELIKRLIK